MTTEGQTNFFDVWEAFEVELRRVPPHLKIAIDVSDYTAEDELRERKNLQKMFAQNMEAITEEFLEYFQRLPLPGSKLVFQDRVVLYNSIMALGGIKKVIVANRHKWTRIFKADILKRLRRCQGGPKQTRPRQEMAAAAAAASEVPLEEQVDHDALRRDLEDVLQQRALKEQRINLREAIPTQVNLEGFPEEPRSANEGGFIALVDEDPDDNLPRVLCPVETEEPLLPEQAYVNREPMRQPFKVPRIVLHPPTPPIAALAKFDVVPELRKIDIMLGELNPQRPNKRALTPASKRKMVVQRGSTVLTELQMAKRLLRFHKADEDNVYFRPSGVAPDRLVGLPKARKHAAGVLRHLEEEKGADDDIEKINVLFEEMMHELENNGVCGKNVMQPSALFAASTPLTPLRREVFPASVSPVEGIATGALPQRSSFPVSWWPVEHAARDPVRQDVEVEGQTKSDEILELHVSVPKEVAPTPMENLIDHGVAEPIKPGNLNISQLVQTDEEMQLTSPSVTEEDVKNTLDDLWSKSPNGEITFADLCPTTRPRDEAARIFTVIISLWSSYVELRQTSSTPHEIFISRKTTVSPPI